MGWTYYTERDGYLYDDDGNREHFDGKKRTACEWDAYLHAEDIRGDVR